jgi:uncharacterized damage-inducible protein DinB
MRETSHLVELCKHNLWANTKLFDFCVDLDDAVLEATAIGCFGTVRHTLLHIANSEADYFALLTKTPTEELKTDDIRLLPLEEIARFYQKFGEGLIPCAREIPGDRMLDGTFDDGVKYRFPASGLFIQALNHATEHRTQIATILTQQGIEPLNLDGWTYSDKVLMPEGAWEK